MFDVLNQIGVPVFHLEVSDTGRATYSGWNEVAEAVSGRTSDSIRGLDAVELYGGRFGTVARDRHQAIIADAAPLVYRLTLPIRNEERMFQTTLSPVLSDGCVTGIFGVSVDVTRDADRSRIDALRLTALEETERFITMAAHDLRTPMRNIGIIVEELRDGFHDLGDGKAALLDHLDQISVRAARLISDVLAHSRAAGAEDLPHETFRLVDLCMDIFMVLDPQGQHDLRAEDVGLTTERPTLQIIIRNLIDNALKHGGEGRRFVSVRACAADMGLQLIVEDDGTGFDEPALAFLGGGEFRYDSGFGLLGLRRLVEARGGRITAEHRPGKQGSLVRVTLPGRISGRRVSQIRPDLDHDVMS